MILDSYILIDSEEVSHWSHFLILSHHVQDQHRLMDYMSVSRTKQDHGHNNGLAGRRLKPGTEVAVMVTGSGTQQEVDQQTRRQTDLLPYRYTGRQTVQRNRQTGGQTGKGTDRVAE